MLTSTLLHIQATQYMPLAASTHPAPRPWTPESANNRTPSPIPATRLPSIPHEDPLDFDEHFCRDFRCCGQVLPDMHALLHHYEECHHLSPITSCELDAINGMLLNEINASPLGIDEDWRSVSWRSSSTSRSSRATSPGTCYEEDMDSSSLPVDAWREEWCEKPFLALSEIESQRLTNNEPADLFDMSGNNFSDGDYSEPPSSPTESKPPSKSTTPVPTSSSGKKSSGEKMKYNPRRTDGRLDPHCPKPYRCPKPGCDKAYKNPNGLKYHRLHGQCSFEVPQRQPQDASPTEESRSKRTKKSKSVDLTPPTPTSPSEYPLSALGPQLQALLASLSPPASCPATPAAAAPMQSFSAVLAALAATALSAPTTPDDQQQERVQLECDAPHCSRAFHSLHSFLSHRESVHGLRGSGGLKFSVDFGMELSTIAEDTECLSLPMEVDEV